jgi:senataxin
MLTYYSPPGSGKTKTIVALVGALMTSQFGERGIAIARPRSIDPRQIPTSATKKLLVCAPSNAAVDELVMRFKEGVKLANGQFQDLAVVRLGRSDAINANVLDVTLEELVNAKLNSASKKRAASGEDIHSIMTTHKATCEELNTLRATIDSARASGKSATQAQEREFDLLKRKKQQLSDKIDAVRDSGETVARNLEIARRKVQQDILDGAHIICATLSGSGHEMFQNLDIEFETVIIDEAAQSIELSALIPLKYGCSKCILVGDPKQLPPTVLSREAARFQYEQSLFVRMQVNHQSDVHLLDTQYRMHPEISSFPSQTFYDGRLLDGEDMAVVRTKPWHQCEILGPYRFFDVQGTHHSAPRGHSLINIAEIEVALKLYERLTTDCQGYDFTGKVGIITPYKSQLRELRSRFAGQYGESILSRVEFNTTDAFQGRESEVIIFSCVRASVTGGIGFLSDIRRMNVGITRAKSSLWVLGNSHSLMKGEFWGRLIQDAKHRDRYTEGNLLAMLEKPLLNLGMESSALAGASSVNSGSKPNQDMQLQGVPTPGIIKNESRRSSSAKQSPVDKPMEDARAANPIKINDNGDQKTQPSTPGRYAPSGGFNGLNSNLNCGICGSSAHWANNCDNEEAKGISSAQCYRCNDPDHRSLQCTAKRCLDCGAFGHIKETCASTQVLSKEAKHNIWKQESAHRHLLSRAPEIQRRRQLGDHAKEVPKVRITSESPPPKTSGTQALQNQQTASGKRKRQPSPSRDVPNKRKVSSSESKDVSCTMVTLTRIMMTWCS